MDPPYSAKRSLSGLAGPLLSGVIPSFPVLMRKDEVGVMLMEAQIALCVQAKLTAAHIRDNFSIFITEFRLAIGPRGGGVFAVTLIAMLDSSPCANP